MAAEKNLAPEQAGNYGPERIARVHGIAGEFDDGAGAVGILAAGIIAARVNGARRELGQQKRRLRAGTNQDGRPGRGGERMLQIGGGRGRCSVGDGEIIVTARRIAKQVLLEHGKFRRAGIGGPIGGEFPREGGIGGEDQNDWTTQAHSWLGTVFSPRGPKGPKIVGDWRHRLKRCPDTNHDPPIQSAATLSRRSCAHLLKYVRQNAAVLRDLARPLHSSQRSGAGRLSIAHSGQERAVARATRQPRTISPEQTSNGRRRRRRGRGALYRGRPRRRNGDRPACAGDVPRNTRHGT